MPVILSKLVILYAGYSIGYSICCVPGREQSVNQGKDEIKRTFYSYNHGENYTNKRKQILYTNYKYLNK
jgi:hypothetical protein